MTLRDPLDLDFLGICLRVSLKGKATILSGFTYSAPPATLQFLPLFQGESLFWSFGEPPVPSNFLPLLAHQQMGWTSLSQPQGVPVDK
jgi:hypothetical protein